jgi:hypothetical protein
VTGASSRAQWAPGASRSSTLPRRLFLPAVAYAEDLHAPPQYSDRGKRRRRS